MEAEARPVDRVVAGRYELRQVLGRGGMGVVWLADDRLLDRKVAVKELTFAVDCDEGERAVLRERTLREARAAARLDHPSITRVFDVVEEDGKPWLVMELVSSRSLQDILEQDGPLAPGVVARIGLDVLGALEAAHASRIVHRDVKPANVLVDREGRACLTDFGIATTTGDSSLTTQGALIGSPSYMAPERAHGEEPRPPVDLWSLGATLYAAVEGRPPFDRGEPMATLLSVVSEHPAPVLRAGPLEPVLRGLLTKDPARRSTAAFARAQLEAVVAGRTPEDPGSAAPPAAPPAPAPRPADHTPRSSASAPVPVPTGNGTGRGRQVRKLPRDVMQRFDREDLRAIAAVSASVLGSVARDQALQLAGIQRHRDAGPGPGPGGGRAVATQRPAGRPAHGWRFKRRWVVVPVLLTVVLAVLIVGGLLALLAAMFGML